MTKNCNWKFIKCHSEIQWCSWPKWVLSLTSKIVFRCFGDRGRRELRRSMHSSRGWWFQLEGPTKAKLLDWAVGNN